MIKTLKKHGTNGLFYEFFVYGSYEEFLKDSKLFFYGRQYLYLLELDNGEAVKLGFSSNIKNRLKTHYFSNGSPFRGKIGRIGVLGPIRDGLNTEEVLHNYMTPFLLKGKYGDSIETYSFDRNYDMCNTNKEDRNSFDTFNKIGFICIQSLTHSREDDDGNPIGFDLILEDNTLSKKEREILVEDNELSIAESAL